MTPTSARRVSDSSAASARPRSLIASTVSPIGVYASQSGMVAATPNMKSALPARPMEIARYMTTMDSTEMIACRLRSCPGCMREPQAGVEQRAHQRREQQQRPRGQHSHDGCGPAIPGKPGDERAHGYQRHRARRIDDTAFEDSRPQQGFRADRQRYQPLEIPVWFGELARRDRQQQGRRPQEQHQERHADGERRAEFHGDPERVRGIERVDEGWKSRSRRSCRTRTASSAHPGRE